MLEEKKGTCCHKCGHVHVKGTSCPTPFLKGEKSCVRKSVDETTTTKHYSERKAERGVITKVRVDKKAYGSYDIEEVNNVVLVKLNQELAKRFTELESKEVHLSKNYNIGYRFFMPVLKSNGNKYPIQMYVSTGNKEEVGIYYLAIIIDEKLVTVMLTNKVTERDVFDQIKDHVKREAPKNTKDAKVLTDKDFVYEIDIDKYYGKADIKTSEYKIKPADLPYTPSSDYRKGRKFTYTDKETGKTLTGIIDNTSEGTGGRGDGSGQVTWIDVKYDKPIGVKSGKPVYIKRYSNILTSNSPKFDKPIKELFIRNLTANDKTYINTMIKLTDILTEDTDQIIYRIRGVLSTNTQERTQGDILSDVRSIEGVSIVTPSDYRGGDNPINNPSYTVALSIKINPHPFSAFNKDKIKDIITQIKKVEGVVSYKPEKITKDSL